jgi:hypothetical protein
MDVHDEHAVEFAAAALRVQIGDRPAGGGHVGRHVDVLPHGGPGRPAGAGAQVVRAVPREPLLEPGVVAAGAGREAPSRIAGFVELVGSPEAGHLDPTVGDRDLCPVAHEPSQAAGLRRGGEADEVRARPLASKEVGGGDRTGQGVVAAAALLVDLGGEIGESAGDRREQPLTVDVGDGLVECFDLLADRVQRWSEVADGSDVDAAVLVAERGEVDLAEAGGEHRGGVGSGDGQFRRHAMVLGEAGHESGDGGHGGGGAVVGAPEARRGVVEGGAGGVEFAVSERVEAAAGVGVGVAKIAGREEPGRRDRRGAGGGEDRRGDGDGEHGATDGAGPAACPDGADEGCEPDEDDRRQAEEPTEVAAGGDVESDGDHHGGHDVAVGGPHGERVADGRVGHRDRCPDDGPGRGRGDEGDQCRVPAQCGGAEPGGAADGRRGEDHVDRGVAGG